MGVIFISSISLSEEDAFSKVNAFDDNYFIRNNPKYDYVIGNDRLPHFRVSFWVPFNATSITPYTPYDIITNVSNHGSIETWTVVDSDKYIGDMKLIYVFVPKRFILVHGSDFWKYVYVKE